MMTAERQAAYDIVDAILADRSGSGPGRTRREWELFVEDKIAEVLGEAVSEMPMDDWG